jgi:hypothetical protein
MKKAKLFNAPIPGENLTANTKNYAWHRPPQYAEFDDAFEYVIDDIIGNQDRLVSGLTIVRSGVSAVALTQTLMVGLVSEGKISPDMSILLAGPVYKTLTKLFDAFGMDYLTGFETTEELKEYASRLEAGGGVLGKKEPKKLTAAQKKEMEAITEEAKETVEIPTGGLMGQVDESEQMDIPLEMDTGSAGLVPKMEEEEAK